MAIQANKVISELALLNINFVATTGTPTLVAKAGTLGIRTDGTAVTGRLFINTDGASTWTTVL